MAYSQIYLGTATTLSGLSLTNSTALIVDRGNQTIIGALDRSAAVSTCDIIWGKASTVTFKGTSGDPLKIKVTRVFSGFGSGGTLYYTPVATTARLKNGNATQMYLGGTGTLTNLENSGQGFTSIDTAVTVTNIYIDGGNVVQTFHTSGEATGRNTLVVVAGGSYTTERGVSGTYNQGGGTAVFSRSDSSGALPTASGATMNIFGGTMKWRGKNIGTLNVYGGTVDFSEAPQDLTVTTLNITRTSRDASTFKSKFSTVTVTTTNVRGAEADVTY